MRRELTTEDKLMSQVRQQEIERLSEVKAAYMESDERTSVISYDTQSRPVSQRRLG
ncbi:YetF domain-containing protein [Leptolyngbya sp. FACHB-261]|uniref:YetF domain-containing protein n=1 Tax=Leptolyngbya sp. FACHB-261 TaxID=2692806 RepID=UPI0028C4454A|nr:YetF domain-containing protein [Leptolyngbya sp. FACHB-261]